MSDLTCSTAFSKPLHRSGDESKKQRSKRKEQRDVILKELVEIWQKGADWHPRTDRTSPERSQDQQIHSVLRSIAGGLKSLGLLPKQAMGLPTLNKPLDGNRLSGFLYNISMYLQEMSAELDEHQEPFNNDLFWENLLYAFFQPDDRAPFVQWEGRVPPRPSFRLQDLFFSLRGSPHWDGLLGLVQSILTFVERQPQRPILTFVSQNWKTISALLEAALQALVSGTYGQANAGLQGVICVLKGRNDCAFNLSWLQQLLSFLETRNWKPVVNVHPVSVVSDPREGSPSTGRLKPFFIPPEVLHEENLHSSNASHDVGSLSSMQTILLQALSRSSVGERAVQFAEHNPALLQGLDGLRHGFLHRLGSTVYSNLKRKVSRVTTALLDDLESMAGDPVSSHQGRCSPTDHNQTDTTDISAEILEAACNASIPGLTGVSNFTVFLYCTLFDGIEATLDPGTGHIVPDLHASCSNAAWYLSAAEEDFLWVHVCSEFFAQEFNNTVCANSSFWLQRAHQAAIMKDHYYLNQSSIDDLCLQLSMDVSRSSASDASEDCLALLSTGSLSAHDFRSCFLPNNSVLISALCGNASSPLPRSGWALEYCSKALPTDSQASKDRLCDFSKWTAEHLANSSILGFCGDTAGLRDYICKNMTRYLMLVRVQPSLSEYCSTAGQRQCVLQQLFDMLPAPYDFDTSQLCRNPIPILQEALYKLSLCEGFMDEHTGWLATVSYVLHVLDFMVGLSAGLEEGEQEVRQGLGQAILLSSLLDNASFWATLRPDASDSVLQTVSIFLRRERNPALKEDLLGCFSPVLWDLIQKEDNSTALRFLMQLSHWLGIAFKSLNASILSTPVLASLHGVLPQLGVSFLQSLSSPELLALFTLPGIPVFPPAQAFQILSKISQETNISANTLCQLRPLFPGLAPTFLRNMTVHESVESPDCECWSSLLTDLQPAHRAMVHRALEQRKCAVEELRRKANVDLNSFSPSFTAGLPVTMMERLSNTSLMAVLNHIRRHFIDFLWLPRHKQMALAEKAIDVLGISEGHLSGASLDMLGPLLLFLDMETLAQVDREALKLRLEDIRQYCMPSDSFREMAALLTQKRMLGETKQWTVGDVEHIGRLVFALSPQQIRSLPLDDLGKDTVEQVLQSQLQWKNTVLGKACADLKGLKDKIYSLVHKIIKGQRWTRREPTPSCADVKGTFPSAWRWYQLKRMKRKELEECAEFMGQDGTLDSEQRRVLWEELRLIYKPVRTLRPEQFLELGCIVTEMGERELQIANLSNLAVVAHLGSFNGWKSKKMRAALQGVMRRWKQKPKDLGVVELVSLGHLLCGFSTEEIFQLDPTQLSVAASFLREMVLPCSEEQAEALAAKLASPLGFGPVSTWGAEVFTEIGTLAAGLEDMVVSSLVKEQIEGLTPSAIALISPRKMTVVLSATQLSWFNPEQACAVTEEQWEDMSSEQRQALSMAQFEGDMMFGHRARDVYTCGIYIHPCYAQMFKISYPGCGDFRALLIPLRRPPLPCPTSCALSFSCT
ncbi:hypothetical protein P4O66_000518 [Electrophorus voltai]|uniref:Stereocilin LRR domain-containing protein n=1 Tax=Electrophorus voltai TaxID=2609070 RepID=A0AAD8ZEL0_9TELE|nr:hypothetical protein P4O66_000518 [Electrophorus voltai]